MEKEINSGNRISSQENAKKEFQEQTFDINKIYETLKRRRRILFSVSFFVFCSSFERFRFKFRTL